MASGPFEPSIVSLHLLPEEDEFFLTPPPPRPQSRQSLFSLLKGPFLRLWIAQALSQTANNMVNFALLLLVQDIIQIHNVEQANTAISLVILAFSLPSVLFGPIAGVLADRWDRKLLMAAMNALRAVSVISFLIINPEWHVGSILAAIYFLTFIFGIAGQFFAPALGASIPSLVPRPQLIQANALFNLTFTAAQLIGFATIGPLLVKVVGIDRLFEITAIIFVLCTGLVLTLPKIEAGIAPNGADASRKMLGDVKEGITYILNDPYLIKAIVYLTVSSSTFLMVAALGPTFLTTVIGIPAEDIGYIVAPAGLGVVVGVLLVPAVARRFERNLLIDSALTIAGAMLFCLAVSPTVLDLALDKRRCAVECEDDRRRFFRVTARDGECIRARAIADDLAGTVTRAHSGQGLRDVLRDLKHRLVRPDLFCGSLCGPVWRRASANRGRADRRLAWCRRQSAPDCRGASAVEPGTVATS